MSFNLATALGSIAPTLAGMLGGPLASTAVTALEGVFGLAPGSGAEKITEAIQAGQMTPETIASMRAADQRHAEEFGRQGIDLLRINADHEAAMATVDAADRDSARKMQIAKPSPWPGVLSAVTTGAIVSLVLAACVGVHVPEDVLTTRIVDSLLAGWMLSLTYWFGTTRGSSEKTNLLAQSAPGGVQASVVSSTTGKASEGA